MRPSILDPLFAGAAGIKGIGSKLDKLLAAFLRRAWGDGHRAALVVTGKGKLGVGVLKARTPEWLAGPALRDIVAGVSPADKRHGGDGALYVALKRRPPKV